MSTITLYNNLNNEVNEDEVREWALANGCNTKAEQWLRNDLKPEWRIWLACRVLPDSLLRKFSCLCAREVWGLLTDKRSKDAIQVAEMHACGLAKDDELASARVEAWNAVGQSIQDKAWAVAWAMACDAAWYTTSKSAGDAASKAATAAACAATGEVAYKAVKDGVSDESAEVACTEKWNAVRARQSEILRELAPTLKEVQA